MRRILDQIPNEGILLLDKPKGKTSFSLIPPLRKLTGVQKIGHTGTLDPFATGLMVLLIGKKYTRLSDSYLQEDKEYTAEVFLGSSTDTYDCEGKIVATSSYLPTLDHIEQTLTCFQGSYLQTPPMFSAKKVKGKKLYHLARQGIEIPRTPIPVQLKINLLTYTYPLLTLHVTCSKGTYIRSLAHDLGLKLTTFAHLTNLRRLRSGPFHIDQAISGDILYETSKFTKRTV